MDTDLYTRDVEMNNMTYYQQLQSNTQVVEKIFLK